MFGYIAATKEGLSDEGKRRYRSLYCGLCRELKREYGTLCRLTLNFDTVFLILILQSAFEETECVNCRRCLLHPAHKCESVSSKIVSYAADATVILTYHKLCDDVKDEHKKSAKFAAFLLKKAYFKACKKQPELAKSIKTALDLYYNAEENRANADVCAGFFAQSVGAMFALGDDFWKPKLYDFGESLGRLIYALDAYDDFDGDKKRGRFNPFSEKPSESMLKMLASDCVAKYEILPITRDTEIIKNILYFGVWSNLHTGKGKKND